MSGLLFGLGTRHSSIAMPPPSYGTGSLFGTRNGYWHVLACIPFNHETRRNDRFVGYMFADQSWGEHYMSI